MPARTQDLGIGVSVLAGNGPESIPICADDCEIIRLDQSTTTVSVAELVMLDEELSVPVSVMV